MKAKWRNYTLDQLKELVKQHTSFAGLQTALGYSTKGGSATARLRKVLDDNGIDYSHFKGHAWNKKEYDTLTDFGVINRQQVREIVLQERPYQCECCGITEWQGKPITLQIHHIDGDSTHNTRDNIQLLCPNCHSQTENWCSRNNTNKVSDAEFLVALLSAPNICSACRAVGLTPNQNNYRRAKKLIDTGEKVKEAK